MAWGEKYIYKPYSLLPVYKTSSTPIIDGLWDPSWAFTPEVSMQKTVLDVPSDWFDLYGTFRTMWDEENIYLWISAQDEVLRTDNANMWNNDVIELFFDGDNSKNNLQQGYDENDIQMRFEYMSDSWQAPNTEYAYHQTNRGYNLELRIPANDLKFDPSEELIIGFDTHITDNDDGTQNSIIRWWSDDINNWQDPSLFGIAKLSRCTISAIKEIAYTPSPITVDAEMDHSWIGKELQIANNIILGEEHIILPEDVKILWNALWDNNYLYFWFDVQDDILFSDSENEYYQDDCIEVWLDGDNSKSASIDEMSDFGLQFRYHTESIIEPVKKAIGPSIALTEINQAAKLTTEGFILEIAIPLENLSIEAYDSTYFGFDLDYNDDDDGGERETKLKTYARYDDSWQRPSEWATAMLNGSGRVKQTPNTINYTESTPGQLHVYPNPFQTSINLALHLEEESQVSINLISLSGKLIYSEELYITTSGFFNRVLNISQLPDGLYVLEVVTNKNCYVKKIQKTGNR
ncbi:hypothetical protein ES705_37929 [subsurface metagenome]